jgi:hypothetical protein
MVNYDTIAGGDIVYVHSAHSDVAEYNCADPSRYSFDPKVRDRLLAISQQTATPFAIHPSYSGYPEGRPAAGPIMPLCLPGGAHRLRGGHQLHHQRGRWHTRLFQSTNPALWDRVYDATKSACDRDSGRPSGAKIWHTEHDRLDKMSELFPTDRAAARGQYQSDNPLLKALGLCLHPVDAPDRGFCAPDWSGR